MRRSLVAYLGHHKCATTWISTIAAVARERLGLTFVNVSGPDMFAHRLDEFVARRRIDILSYVNANAAEITCLGDVVDTPLRQKTCRRCNRLFAICGSCDRGHAYCSSAVRHLTPEHRAWFKQRYNHVLVKLGYEQSADW